MQGYFNLKGYWEFAAENRPDGWNAWVTFSRERTDCAASSASQETPATEPQLHSAASA